MFGVNCGLVKTNGKMISKVLTPKGEESKLYGDILDLVKDLPKEQKEKLQDKYKSWESSGIVGDLDNNKHLALAVYAQTTSPNFTKLGLPKNDKGEYDIKDVTKAIFSPKEDVLKQLEDSTGKTTPSKASLETQSKYKEWAQRAGYDWKSLEELTDINGDKIGTNGTIDLFGKIISIAKGKEDIVTGEEVGHGIIRMVKESEPALFKEIMNNVGKYELYASVIDQYKNDPDYMIDGKPNIPKLKEETAGKIFNELVIKRLEGKTEKPELLAKANTWFDKVKEMIKNLLTKIGFDPTFDPLEKTAKKFTKGELDKENPIKDLTDRKKDESYEDFKSRTLTEIQNIAANVPDKTAIITHGTVIGLLKGLDGKTKNTKNGEVYTKEVNGKTLYFVRHGQTDNNITKVDNEVTTPINEKGIEDAKKAAQELKELGVTNVISTDTTRTKSTASIIRDELGFKDIFKQKTEEEKKQEELFDKLSKPPIVEKKEETNGSNHYEDGAGNKIARVTDLVKNFLTDLFKNKELKENLDTVLNEFKKQYGTARHKDMENMHERHIDPLTGLLRENTIPIDFDSTYFAEHSDEDKANYKVLEGYLYGYTDEGGIHHEGMITNKVDFPEGTKFMWEKTVYDPTLKVYDTEGKKSTKGLAGTIDFMAITPIGKVSVFDWKFIGSLAKHGGVRDYMKKAYDKQMAGYVKILTSPTYGVSLNDIEKVRMIPVSVKYNEEKGHEGEVLALNIGTTDYKNEKTPYLLPYVTSSEQNKSTPIQTLITALTHTLNLTAAKGSNEKDIIVRKNKIENLEKAILHLQLAQDFRPFLEQVKGFNRQTIDNMKKIREDYQNFPFKDIKNISELDEKLEPLIDIIKSLELYSSLGKLRDFIDDSTEEGKKQREDLGSLSRNAAYLLSDNDSRIGAKTLLNQYMKSWADSRSIWDILKPQVLLDYLAKEFRTPSKSPSTVIRAAYDLNNIRLNKVETETNEMVAKLKPIWEAVTKEWGGVKKLSEIVEAKDKNDKGTNRLINEFSTETYTKLEKTIADKKPKETRELLDDKKFNAWAMPFREQQIKQINASQWLPYLGKTAEERKQDAIEKVMSETTWSSEYSMSNLSRLKNFLKDDLRSKEYKEMLKPENKPALDFYNFVTDINKQAAAAGMFHHAHISTFLPWIEKSLADKVEYGGRWNLWDQVRKGFTSIKQGETAEAIDPFTNKVISKIPKYFVREISRENPDGSKDYSNVADDLIKNVGIFAEAVIDYRSKRDIESTLEALKIVEESKGMLITDSRKNIVGHSDVNLNIQHLIDYLEVHINDKSILSKLDLKGGHVTIDGEEREYDVRKTLDTLKAYFSYNVLGLNTVTSIFRSLTTGTTGWFNSGKYYNSKEFLQNYANFTNFATFRNDASLTTKLMREFLPVDENLKLDLDHLAGSKIADADFQAFSMKMVKSAHNIVQYVNYLTHMENAIIVNGKLMNAREYANRLSKKYELSSTERKDFEKSLDKTVSELVDKYGLIKHSKVDDKGKLSIDGLDLNDFSVIDFKNMIRTQGRMLAGNISENDQSHIRTNAVARQMFLFTNWLPQSIDQRFGGLAYNQGIQAYEYGRMRMLANIWVNSEGNTFNVIKKIKNLSDLYKANDEGVKGLHRMYEEHKAEFLRKNGTELHMTPDEFYDMVRENIKIQSKELLALLTFIGLSVGLSAALPKKDDPEWENAQGYFSYIKRVINRGKDELEMFFNPLKFAEFGSGSKLPVLGVFGELTAAISHLAKYGYGVATGDDTEKMHFIPQIIHTLPNGKAIYDVGSVIFPVWYKENTGTVLNPEPQVK